MSGVNDGGSPRPPYSSSISNGAAQNHGPSPTVTLPAALTTASAATLMPPCVAADAEPRPPFKLAVVAPRPAPTLPSAKSCRRGRRGVAEIAIWREAAPLLVAAVEQIEADRARHDRNDGFADPQAVALLGEPGLHAACRHPVRMPSRPPARCRGSARTVATGSSSDPSRVPGPPPRTSIEAIAGLSKIIAVTPEAERGVVGVADADAGNISKKVVHGACLPIGIRLAPSDTVAQIFNCRAPSGHPGEFGLAIGFGEQQHAGIEAAVMNDGVLGIARREQYLECRAAASAPRRPAGGRSCGRA